MQMRVLRRCLAFGAALLMQTAFAADPATSSMGAASAPAAPPTLQIKCVVIRDRPLSERVFGFLKADTAARGIDGASKQSSGCNGTHASDENRMLVGTGDLELVIDRVAYDLAAQYETMRNGSLLLYLNGVALPADAQLVGVEHSTDGHTHLRYRINQGEDSQTLWSSLYRDKGLWKEDSLRPALGWRTTGPSDIYGPSLTPDYSSLETPKIAISSPGQVGMATFVLAALIVSLLLVGRNTDALRDAHLPAWWHEAREIRARLTAAGNDPAAQRAVLVSWDAAFQPGDVAECMRLAEKALAGEGLPDTRPGRIPIGLALRPGELKETRSSFSLSRVQLAVWFAFAISAGLFLWIIYGQLRRLDGSLLLLLMISVGTTGVSLGVDRNAGGRPYSASKGLFQDLVTGFDDSHQVHRYQAVVVNLLLLFVGISHVLQQLTYPIFDATWLALLGVSGAALGLGKEVLEKPKETQPAPVKEAPPPAVPAADGSPG